MGVQGATVRQFQVFIFRFCFYREKKIFSCSAPERRPCEVAARRRAAQGPGKGACALCFEPPALAGSALLLFELPGLWGFLVEALENAVSSPSRLL